MVRPSGLRGAGSMKRGQADAFDELRARVSSWPPLRPARLRRARGSVVVVQPTAPLANTWRGSDEARDRYGPPPHFCGGGVLGGRSAALARSGRHDPLGAGGLRPQPGQERRGGGRATGNAMAVVRVLRPYVARVIGANPLQVKAIAHAHVK